jgi:hypothetical protein
LKVVFSVVNINKKLNSILTFQSKNKTIIIFLEINKYGRKEKLRLIAYYKLKYSAKRKRKYIQLDYSPKMPNSAKHGTATPSIQNPQILL